MTISKITLSTFATLSKAQLSAVSAYAVETYLLSITNEAFTFKEFNQELSIELGLAIKTVQNYASVARKLQSKYAEKLATFRAINAENRDIFKNLITDDLSKGGYSATLCDIDNYLSNKPSVKAAAKAAATPKTESAPEIETAPKTESAPEIETAPLTAFVAIMETLSKLTLSTEEWAQVVALAADKAGFEVNMPEDEAVQLAA